MGGEIVAVSVVASCRPFVFVFAKDFARHTTLTSLNKANQDPCLFRLIKLGWSILLHPRRSYCDEPWWC